MSFRKMKLVSEDPSSIYSNIYKHDTSVNISRLSDLDQDIKTILNQDIDESSKAKLYSQTLRRFLTFKKLKQEEDLSDQFKPFEDLKGFLEKQRLMKLAEKEARRKSIASRIKKQKSQKSKELIPSKTTPLKIRPKKLKKSEKIDKWLTEVSKSSDKLLTELKSKQFPGNIIKTEDDWESYE